jgi:hypothetical protein
MWMPSKNGGEPPAEGEAPAETQPTSQSAFRHIYGFILQAVKGDKGTADAIFEDYLAGKLSEELLSISRRCVSADKQAHLTATLRRDGVETNEEQVGALE